MAGGCYRKHSRHADITGLSDFFRHLVRAGAGRPRANSRRKGDIKMIANITIIVLALIGAGTILDKIMFGGDDDES